MRKRIETKTQLTRDMEEIFNKSSDPIEIAKKRVKRIREEREKEIRDDLGI